MNIINSEPRSGISSRFFWTLSFKNRQILIPILISLVLIGAIFVVQKFIAMDMRLKKLSLYEPIYVLSVNKNLNIGETIKAEDLSPIIFYKHEYEKLNYTEPGSNVSIPSYIQCHYENNKISGIENILGRVVNLPIHAHSILRREYLAPQGTMPGLINLIDERHSLVDIEVPQSGFNVFIKPNDYVDLYESNKTGSRLLASKVKVILVDSLALGQAPLQVEVNSRSSRHLSLAIPEELYSIVTQAKLNKTLTVTYKNNKESKITKPNPRLAYKAPVNHLEHSFQPLLLIQGKKKEVLKQ